MILVLLAALQWPLLLWAESTAMAAAQDLARAATVLEGSTKDDREAGRWALSNSALDDTIVKVDRTAAFTTAVVEETAIRVLPMMDIAVYQAVRVPTGQIR